MQVQPFWGPRSHLLANLGAVVVLIFGSQWISRPLWAAGAEYPDNGTLSIGRGGAWAANPTDGLALTYNPAGLAQQHGLKLTLDARLSQQNVKFTSTSIKGDPVENSAPLFLGPTVALSYGMGALGPLSEATIAAGVNGPSAIGIVKYPNAGVQRYNVNSTDYFIGFYSLAVAAGYGDWLRFGITGQLAHGEATFDQAVYSSATSSGSDPNDDTIATFSGKNGVQPNAIIGVTVLPTPQIAIGLSWRPSLKFAADGTLKTVAPKWAQESSKQVGDEAQLQLTFADVVRLGLQYKPNTNWDVEFDAVYERWSVLKEVRVHIINMTVVAAHDPDKPIKVPDIVFPHDYVDTISLRMGADYTLMPERLTVRGGYLYESSAAPTKYVSLDFPNWQRHVVSVGASIKLYGAWLDLAFAHHFVQTQVVTDSAVVQQQTPPVLPLPQPKPIVVGNGTYEASMNIGSVALRVPFGSLSSVF